MSGLRKKDTSPPVSGFEATQVPVSGFDATQAQLTAAWDVRGIDIANLQFEGGTAVSRGDRGPSSQRVRTLPMLLTPGSAGAAPHIRIGDVLGEGGMGVVRLAEQPALNREVAVKMLKPGAGTDEAPQLLREARVTGVLEHPNIVPVYALGRDDDDRPLLVMKRITGRSWGSLLDETPVADRMTDAFLRRHLAILSHIAMAVHYAHSKGIIHRDLKPENVMIGGFGEVYVVDWGIAVSVEEDNVGGVPRARDISAIEGTPAYLAPEMAAGDGELIDQRSDVYLLGAMLHEILTGEPPHSGRTILMVLTRAFASEPKQYGPEVPRDLAAICRTAMARFPEDRHPSAAAFAVALEEFLVHRSSMQLSDEAGVRLEDARALLRRRKRTKRLDERLYALLSACQFAFTQALRSWPQNERATAGLQATLELMIRHELARDAPQAAEMLVSQLPRKDRELARRVRRALEKKRRADRRLTELARDTDETIGAGSRRVVTMMISALYGITVTGCGLVGKLGIYEVGHQLFAALNAAYGAFVLVNVMRRRDTLLATAVNRRLAVLATLVFASYAAMWLYTGAVGVPMDTSAALHAMIGITFWTGVALTVNRDWLPITYGSACALLLILLFPRWYFEALGATGALSSMIAAARTFEKQ